MAVTEAVREPQATDFNKNAEKTENMLRFRYCHDIN
jgi:hypothetical protein